MTIHKIDREKLAEAVEYSQEATPRIDGEYWTTMRQAAENWLAITDPGFEPSEEMVEAGAEYAYHEMKQHAKGCFKTMIATMIKGE